MLLLKVAGMTCAHCVAAVTQAVSALPGVTAVRVDLAGESVAAFGNHDPISVREAIKQQGYEVIAE